MNTMAKIGVSGLSSLLVKIESENLTPVLIPIQMNALHES